jgi:hypothetical protein
VGSFVERAAGPRPPVVALEQKSFKKTKKGLSKLAGMV